MDLHAAREVFETSQDLTVGIEEEWALVDPPTLELVPRFEALRADGAATTSSPTAISGELISSEIEIRSGRGEDVAARHPAPARGAPAAVRARRHPRRRRSRPPARTRCGLPRAAHHRHRALPARAGRPEVRRVAQQHVRAAGPHRRQGRGPRDQGLRPAAAGAPDCCSRSAPTRRSWTAATPACTPRARRRSPSRSRAAASPTSFGSWADWQDYVDLLLRTNSIVEFTQLWWSVRAHHSFGTIEVRICDAQTTGPEADGLIELIVGCVAQALREIDAGEVPPPVPGRLIEENMWRAIRYGQDGKLLDLEAPKIEEFPASEAATA